MTPTATALTDVLAKTSTGALITSALLLETVPFMDRTAEQCLVLSATCAEIGRRHPEALAVAEAWLAEDEPVGTYTDVLCAAVAA